VARGDTGGWWKMSFEFPILHPERAKAVHPELVEGCGTHFLTRSQVKKQIFDARC
jgi:hypothetical protein